MKFAWNKALNEQKHETPPVFARIGNKHISSSDIWAIEHLRTPLVRPKEPQVGLCLCSQGFLAGTQVT